MAVVKAISVHRRARRSKANPLTRVALAMVAAGLLTASGLEPGLAAGPGSSPGQQAGNEKQRSLGRWIFSEATDGVPECTLTLGKEQVIGGQAARPGGGCNKVRDGMDDVYAWFIRDDGVLVLIDATRQPLLRFERGGPDWFIHRRPDGQPLYLHFDK